MRVLFEHWNYSSDSLEGVSMFGTYKGLVQGCLRGNRDLRAYYAAPRPIRDGDRTPLDWSEDRVKECGFHPLKVNTPFRVKEAFPRYEGEFLDLVRNPAFCADFVLTGNYVHAAGLRALQHSVQSQWSVNCHIPIIAYFTESTLCDGLQFQQMHLDEIAGAICLTGAVGPIAVMNDFDRDELWRLGDKYLSPYMRQKLRANTLLIPPCFDEKPIDDLRDEYAKQRAEIPEDQTVIFHGGTPDSLRRVAEIVKATEKARMTGANIVLHLTTQNKLEFEQPWIKVVNECSGLDYLKEFGRADFCWWGSDYEGTALGYMEAAYSGMLPICNHAALWTRRIGGDYPVQVNQATDPEYMAKVLTVVAERKNKLISEWRDKVIQRMKPWTGGAVGPGFLDTCKKAIQPTVDENIRQATKCFAFQFLEKAPLPDALSLDAALEIMTQNSDQGINFKWVGHRSIRYMLMALGYEDNYVSDCVIMSKK